MVFTRCGVCDPPPVPRYWGILNLMRKLALSGMLIFFSRGSVAQVPPSAPSSSPRPPGTPAR
jgi:hypothetical protein